MLREAVEGPVAGQRQHRAVLLLGELRAVVRDVLAGALLAAAAQADQVVRRSKPLDTVRESPSSA